MSLLGFNGGLMGVRRTSTSTTATGLWSQNEQSVAKRAQVWPNSGGIDQLQFLYTTTLSFGFTNPYPTWTSVPELRDGTIDNFDIGMVNGNMGWPGTITLDLFGVYLVDRVLIGTGGGANNGGWSGWHPGAFRVESSINGTDFTIENNNYWMSGYSDPAFQGSGGQPDPGIYAIPLSSAPLARYIKLVPNPGQGYVWVSEFTALSPGQQDPYAGIKTPYWP
jgi:hypothetical protein